MHHKLFLQTRTPSLQKQWVPEGTQANAIAASRSSVLHRPANQESRQSYNAVEAEMEGGWRKQAKPNIRLQQTARQKSNAKAEDPASLQAYIEAPSFAHTVSQVASQDADLCSACKSWQCSCLFQVFGIMLPENSWSTHVLYLMHSDSIVSLYASHNL